MPVREIYIEIQWHKLGSLLYVYLNITFLSSDVDQFLAPLWPRAIYNSLCVILSLVYLILSCSSLYLKLKWPRI